MDVGYFYDVNVESSSILINFVATEQWGYTSFEGIAIDSLNDSSGNALQGVSVETNMEWTTTVETWNTPRLSFDNDSVFLNWMDLSFNDSTYCNVYLDFGSQSVPEPTTMLLLGAGLMGLVGIRPKRNQRN